MLKQQKGMTLLNLVFVILLLLAIAAVAIAMVLDQYKYDPEPKQVDYVAEQTVSPTQETNSNVESVSEIQ